MKKVNSRWNDFFKEERKRVFEPGPFFVQKVMARLGRQPARENGFWETVVAAARPVMALALTVLLAVVGIEMFLPTEPARGMIEASLIPEISDGERLLYMEPDIPPDHDLLEHLIVLEGGESGR
jgi:hypothetical protein